MSSLTLGFENKLWEAADKLRGNLESSEYKHVLLGLVFLKYISDSFEERYNDLVKNYPGMEEECVIHMASQALIKSVNLSAKKLKRNESVASAFGIELTDSVKIAAPSIKKTIFQMECKLHQHITRLMGNYYATHYEMEKLVHLDLDKLDEYES